MNTPDTEQAPPAAAAMRTAPPAGAGGHRRPRTRALADLAADLRAVPGAWAHVGTYATTGSANTTASLIRKGRLATFRDAGPGVFEAETRTSTTDGTHQVWARYVGANAPADGQQAVGAPLSDDERRFLRFALELASDAILDNPEDFTAADRASLDRLLKLAGEA